MHRENQSASAAIPELMTLRQAAELCGVSDRTLWGWARSGAAPAPLKIGKGTVRYSRPAYIEWIKAGCPRCNRGAQAMSEHLISADALARDLEVDVADLFERTLHGTMPQPCWRRDEILAWVANYTASTKSAAS